MATFRLYPRSHHAKSSSIQLRIRSGKAGSNSLKIGTGIVIDNPDRNWDKKNDRVHRAYSHAQSINMRLAAIKAEAERLYYHAEAAQVTDPIKYVKEELDKSPLLRINRPATPGDSIPAELTLLGVFDRFCEAKRGEYAKATLKSYSTTRMHLSEFEVQREQTTMANDVSANWIDAFRRSLRMRGLTDNSLRRSLKILKTCLRWAEERGYVSNDSYVRAIRLGNERESLTIALTAEQLKQIETVDLSNRPGLNRVRWWFLAQCCTGVRFADLHNITASNAKDGWLSIRPRKTKDQMVRLEVTPLLQRAFKELNDRPLDFTAQHYNRMLKDLGRALELNDVTSQVRFVGSERIENLVPMYQLLSSHTARRTFITILLRAGEPQEFVMRLSGHKDVRSFMKYVKMTDHDTTRILRDVFQ